MLLSSEVGKTAVGIGEANKVIVGVRVEVIFWLFVWLDLLPMIKTLWLLVTLIKLTRKSSEN